MTTTCPNCGANLEVNEDHDVLFCSYCGYKIPDGRLKKIKMEIKKDIVINKMNVIREEKIDYNKKDDNKLIITIIFALFGFAMILMILGASGFLSGGK
jgi:DNA-directed RNA polymerase subunit RPC12/RpoP